MELLKQIKPQLIQDLKNLDDKENIDVNRLRSYLEILVALSDEDIIIDNNEEENKELAELYGKRPGLPKEQWVKAATTKETILERMMKNKKEIGWKFKNE